MFGALHDQQLPSQPMLEVHWQDVAKGDGVPDIAILPAIASQVCSQITEMYCLAAPLRTTSCCNSFTISGVTVISCFPWHEIDRRLEVSRPMQQPQHKQCLNGNSMGSSNMCLHTLHTRSSIDTPPSETGRNISLVRSTEQVCHGPAT